MELCEKNELGPQEECIATNFKMVWDVIHTNHFEPTEDNFQIGCIGLLKAYRKFNTDMHTKFSTFAYPCIRNEILLSKRKKRISTCFLEDTSTDLYESNFVHVDHYKTRSIDSIIKEAVDSVCNNEKDKAIFFYIYKAKIHGLQLTQLSISKRFNIPAVKITRCVKKINQKIKNIIDKDCLL